MRTVAEILAAKGNPAVFSVQSTDTVLYALRQMAERSVGALPVVDDGKLVGIFSERDYARKIALMERSSANTPVRDIMTANVITIGPSDRAKHCMELMTDKRIRHLPVMVNSELVGMVSIGDLVKNIMEDQEKLIQQLESYIRGH
jgi:CBS domain-containing protein